MIDIQFVNLCYYITKTASLKKLAVFNMYIAPDGAIYNGL
jgi:hypothetical protein